MRKALSTIGILSVLLSTQLFVTACNTVAGVGQDVKAAGQGVENAAKDAQKK